MVTIRSILADFEVNVSELLDYAIDSRISISLKKQSVEQYLKNLDNGIFRLKCAANTVEGDLCTIRKDLLRMRKTVKTLDADVTAFSNDQTSNPSIKNLRRNLDQTKQNIVTLEAREVEQKDLQDKLNETISKLQERHDQMVSELNDIVTKLRVESDTKNATNAADDAEGVIGDITESE